MENINHQKNKSMKKKIDCSVIAATFGPSPQCNSMMMKKMEGIIVVGAGDEKAMDAAKRYLMESQMDFKILELTPENIDKIKLIESGGGRTILQYNDGIIDVLEQKKEPTPFELMKQAFEDLGKANKMLVENQNVKLQTSSVIHPNFQPKYKPVANLPNRNRQPKKSKRKK